MVGDTLVLNCDGLPVSVLPISSMIWQDAVKSIWLQSVRVLENYENWSVRSPSIEMPVPSVVMTENYIRVARAVRFTPDNIFLRDRYRCQYCNQQFAEHELTLDHVLPRTFGGRSTWDNLVAACSPCNNKRGCNFHIQPTCPPYRPTYYEMVERRREFPVEVPDAKWLEYLQWPEDKVIVKPPKRALAKRTATIQLEQLMAAE